MCASLAGALRRICGHCEETSRSDFDVRGIKDVAEFPRKVVQEIPQLEGGLIICHPRFGFRKSSVDFGQSWRSWP